MATIFVSYSRGTASVLPLIDRLKEAKYRVWFDRNDIHIGDSNWQASINSGLIQCDAVLLCLTPTSCNSTGVQHEVKQALLFHKPIFPVMLELLEDITQGLIDVGLSPLYHVEDFSQAAYWDERCRKLLNDLHSYGIRITKHEARQNYNRNTSLYHRQYLAKLIEKIGRVSFSIAGNDDLQETLLENVYLPLPTNLALDVEISDYRIVDWWLGDEGQYLGKYVSRTSSEVPKSTRKKIEELSWEKTALELLIAERQEYYDMLRDEKVTKELTGEFYREVEDGVYLADIRLNIDDVMASSARLVLLGQPGSGKSTCVKHLALMLAVNQTEDSTRKLYLAMSSKWPHGHLTPVYIELRHFVASAYFPSTLEEQPTFHHLWNYIVNVVLGEELHEYVGELQEDLIKGTAIVILDGLDEIPFPRGKGKLEARQRQLKSLAVSIQDAYPQARILVTSRPYAYSGWSLTGFSNVTLSSLERPHRIDLGSKLYLSVCMTAEEARDKALRLDKALKNVDSELKDNPLFFTLMATLFYQGEQEGLPAKAGTLYYQSILLLLERWVSRKKTRVSLSTLLGGLTLEKLIERLAILAFEVHDRLGENPGTPEIPRWLLYEHIFSLEREDDTVQASALLSYLSENAGVLVSPGQDKGYDVFHFAHRTFQEYLAALHIVRLCIDKQSYGFVKGLIEERPQLWRMPCLLVDDVLARMEKEDELWLLIEDLLPEHPPTKLDLGDERCWSAWLAGQNAIDQNLHLQKKLRRGEKITRDVLLNWLTKIVETPNSLPLQERVEVGDSLGLFGDSRPGVGVINGIPDIEWCHVPAGVFLMGTDREVDLLIQEDEPDIFSIEIDEFYIAKYPITYAQFEAFQQGDGYTNRSYWTQSGWDWKGSKKYPEIYWHTEGWHISNHPVVGLTWYEAYAYTQWLSNKLGFRVRLPTEAEIQKAARGVDGRTFPYGNLFDRTKGNTAETGIGRSSPVGLFLDGSSPYGAQDMSGNIFEWCLSHWTNPYEHHTVKEVDVESEVQRVRTGGSCQRDAALARTAFRIGFAQRYRSYSSGLRVVCEHPNAHPKPR